MFTKLVSMAFISNTLGDKLIVEEVGQQYKKGELIIDLSPSLKSKLVRVAILPRKKKVKVEIGELFLITRHSGVSVRDYKEDKNYLKIDMRDLQCRVEGYQLDKA